MTVEWVETTAKTLEEATNLALDRLGVAAADAEVQILEEPRSGLFGRTRGEARVRARVAPTAPRPKNERRRRGRRDDEGGTGSKGRGKGGGSRSTSKEPEAAARQGGGADSSSDSRRTRANGDAGSGRGDTPRDTRGSTSGDGRTRDAGDTTTSKERDMMPETEQRQSGEEFLTGLLAAFGFEAEVRSDLDDEGILSFEVEGEQLGLLVGPGLATLDAVQEVCRNAIQRQAAGREYGKVTLDVAAARAQRRIALSEFARTEAARVLEDGDEVVFEPMTRGDRKVIHDVVAEFEGLATESVGEDPRRRVVLRRA